MSNDPAEQELPKVKGRRSPAWRDDPVILERLTNVERLRLRGHPNTAIAIALGVDEKTIRRDVMRLQELWRERAGSSVASLKAQAIRELDEVKRLSMESYDRDRDRSASHLSNYRASVMDQMRIVGALVEKIAETDAAGVDIPLDVLRERYRQRADRNEES